MSDGPEPKFVRGADGILTPNPKLDRWSTRGYYDPGEALNVVREGKIQLTCTTSIYGFYSHACGNRAKYDPDANGNVTRCGTHSAATTQRRTDKSQAKLKAFADRWTQTANKAARDAECWVLVKSIAAGHSDAKSACMDLLKKYNRAKENN
jgi:hypothetical protein